MRRMLHRDLMRGHMAQRAAIVLLMGLLFALATGVVQGVLMLAA
jgi:hypothetical protein